MKTVPIITILAALSIVTVVAAAPSAGVSASSVQSSNIEGVVAALNAYSAAISAKDIDEVAELVTSDFLIFEGAGVNRGWADYRDHHLGPELEMFETISFEISEIGAEVVDSLAWASFSYATHIEMPERVVDSTGVGTAVLVKGDDGRWRLRHLHTTPERRR